MSLDLVRAALEIALDSMPGIIPASTLASSTVGTPGLFVTTTPHGLTTNNQISISNYTGSTPVINGGYLVNVIDNYTFSLLDIVNKTPIALTATGTGGVVTVQLTAWEGVAFATNNPVPFQKVYLMPAIPENPTLGDGFYREVGMMQITLVYVAGNGTADVTARAELIRSTFKRGATFTASGITVKILRTPQILKSDIVDGSILLPVRIPYQADIFN